MEAKVIRTEEQYREYFDKVQELIHKMPAPGTDESDDLELLSVLIEDYEKNKYPVEAPDPIDAILFRMEEKGLKQADLVPYFGTRSRVSEILSRKRPLTVPMIRALAIGLGISTDTLIGLSEIESTPKKESIDWKKFPVAEMVTRGWIQKATDKAKSSAEEIVKNFIFEMGLQTGGASFRRTLKGEAATPTTNYTLYAWVARIIQKSRETRKTNEYKKDSINNSLIKELSQLSRFESGPLLAKKLLEDIGVSVIIEPHLKGTMLDGAALLDADGTPIIGLTLRNDRIDNFWFTLIHEVAHIWKHMDDSSEAILDDLERPSEDKREAEANRIAREAFIPRSIWKRSDAYLNPSKESILDLARNLKIHPAIIAGRLRQESGNYNLFSDLVGQGEVRKLFKSEMQGDIL
ncbi:ImmA/IrrE family metallo-endopeptidase [Pseudomonas aeruginosa]|nr:ImmA/IrrE family metallo-endopeptidase [Pseudomonas aeruginosa]MBH3990608.1 ImmA/IrrE family metallo-endopeptidase [Pseudomonas aeruginosa]MBH4341754.1 ImmA/IrrE family metallo-endopeptidase [Pseudomonas aeruginosa]MBH4427448.1 ImmA/IrrE family metallo-endopeptidase [Pseudomonas aeruginosa]MDA3148456.1 ImmA/IrrE family metallo-endopeptidase [Pseudomonas aeruginosa]